MSYDHKEYKIKCLGQGNYIFLKRIDHSKHYFLLLKIIKVQDKKQYKRIKYDYSGITIYLSITDKNSIKAKPMNLSSPPFDLN